MNKTLKSKNKAGGPRIDPYLEGLMSKLLDRLVSLEKKMDTVVAQTSAKPAAPGEPPKSRILYEAICADCHKVCEVPFRPSQERPVYCKECFAKRKSGGPGKDFPVLTPVVLPPKPASRLVPAPMPPPSSQARDAKATKPKLHKKAKKKK